MEDKINGSDDLKEGVYFYEEGGALRIVTDDGDLWLSPSLTTPGGMFFSVGVDEGRAEWTFIVRPELIGAVAAYISTIAEFAPHEEDDDEEFTDGD